MLRAIGSGAFAPADLSHAGDGPFDVVAGDFLESDGHTDLALVNHWSDDVSLLRGDGAGGFAPDTWYDGGHHPNAVEIADLDGDGINDVVVSESGGYTEGDRGSVNVYRGRGDGSFVPRAWYLAGERPGDVVVGDFNDVRFWMSPR